MTLVVHHHVIGSMLNVSIGVGNFGFLFYLKMLLKLLDEILKEMRDTTRSNINAKHFTSILCIGISRLVGKYSTCSNRTSKSSTPDVSRCVPVVAYVSMDVPAHTMSRVKMIFSSVDVIKQAYIFDPA